MYREREAIQFLDAVDKVECVPCLYFLGHFFKSNCKIVTKLVTCYICR